VILELVRGLKGQRNLGDMIKASSSSVGDKKRRKNKDGKLLWRILK
jgi:hypothetical protein